MKNYSALFYGAKSGVIGPHPYIEEIKAPSKKQATEVAKDLAKTNDWRFISIDVI